MKILLVFPRIEHGATTYSDKGSWSSILFGYPIITLPHLAGITPSQHTVKIVNENYEDIDFNEQVDLVGITSYTMTAPRVYAIADEFRRRGKKVVLGGYHPTAMPQEAIQHADSVVLGEAELTWPEVIHDCEKGVLRQFYGPNPEFDMAAIPPIRRDLIRQNPMIGAVQSTRGCPNRCEFCAIASFCNHAVKQRPVKNVVEEISQMPNRIYVIHDPSLTVNPAYSRELFKELIRQKVHKEWVSNGNSNVLGKIDDEFLNLAKKSGCVEWFIGFESVSQAALNGAKKTVNKVEDFKKTIKRLHKHGMAVQGGIIFGFDQDTTDIFDMTLEKMYEWELDVVEVNILTPFPGTPLYDRLEGEGRITSRDWKRYNQVDVVFKPKQMTEKELFEGSRKVAKQYYSVPNVIKRAVRTFTIVRNLSAVLPAGTNYTFRRYYKRDFHF
ncbi:MAG: B12-binding domain-containing radical SAM protein [Candidatus Thermoplasmatota archaeon]|nr:B12-binding domain-containing radical SAM protein [Candidatus Thermoplasmatota archaeon]